MKIRSIKWTYFRGRLREQPRLKLKNSAQENRWTVLFSFLTAACGQPCVFWIPSHPTMISCQSLGPMVTGEVWRAGSLRNGWPHRGCQAGISFSANMFLFQLSTRVPSHKPLLIKCSFSIQLCSLASLTYLGRKRNPFSG